MGIASVGFKKLTIRVLDKKDAELGTNLFVINGKQNEGGTSTAKISGLAVDPVKTWASNQVYYISGKGVGDGKIDFELVDIPDKVLAKIVGYDIDEKGVITAGSETQAPNCSVLIEDYDIRGNNLMLGFMTGVFSYDGVEIETSQGKAAELKSDALSYSIGSADDGVCFKKYAGTDTAAMTSFRADFGMNVGSTPSAAQSDSHTEG